MPILRKKEIRTLSENELRKKTDDLSKELMKARGQSASKVNPENPGKTRAIRRTIARINTIKKERGIK